MRDKKERQTHCDPVNASEKEAEACHPDTSSRLAQILSTPVD